MRAKSVLRRAPLLAAILVLTACGERAAEPTASGNLSAQAESQVGIGPAISYSSVPEQPRAGENSVSVVVTDANGKPVSDVAVSATYYMPAMPSMNMPEMRDSFDLAPQGDGRYAGDVNLSMGGTWVVTVVAKRGEESVVRKRFSIVASE